MFSSLWKRILAGILIVLTIAGVYFREEIIFNARLMNVVRVGNAYYEEYPYLTRISSMDPSRIKYSMCIGLLMIKRIRSCSISMVVDGIRVTKNCMRSLPKSLYRRG